MSAQKARRRFSELIDVVHIRGNRYIVERENMLMVVVIPVEEYVTWEKIGKRLHERVKQMRGRNREIESKVSENGIRVVVEAARQA
ncbi:MAG: type II toxin-antitoxin system Phd/YefM family antitoxin [Chloroflexota bacterium]|nr:type II toxin-antitoxin system Phd/YefM family antitoxin [Chloroflexota bacterium]